VKAATVRIATWNLNNRVGMVPFRPEAARAAIALGAELVVFTEYYPRQHHQQFCEVLAESGLVHQLLSHEPGEVANRTLIASSLPLERDGLDLPGFDHQFPANMVAAFLPTLRLRVLGLRVPAYKAEHRAQLLAAWEWLETAAARLREVPALILGDLNIPPAPGRRGIGANFHRILENGWQRATPAGGHSYFGLSGGRSEIDHILASPHCTVRDAEYVTSVPGFTLAGTRDALSDHAALVTRIDIDGAQ
jgi:hypothetical protein